MLVTYAAPCLQPAWVRRSRPTGAKAAGLRFERALARALPRAVHGQWFHYLGQDGPAWCQTDLLLIGAKTVVVIEAKLGDYAGAQMQLGGLYLPVLAAAYPTKAIKGLIVLKHLSQVPEGTIVYETIAAALAGDVEGPVHWPSKGPV
jgi:hypothetical protein